MNLSQAIRHDIAERYSEGGQFTFYDFAAITQRLGKDVKAATHVLRKMHGAGQLEVVGELPGKNGCRASKRYTVVPGASLTLKTSRDYQLETAARAACMAQCAGHLQSVLDNVTRRQQPKAPAPPLFKDKKIMRNKPDRNGITRPAPNVTVHRCMG